MSKLLWMVCFGLCCWISVSQANYVISCRFWGVFHVEKGARYNLTAEDARRTCAELDAEIATYEHLEMALASGFEICRYGWTGNNTVVIPRITPIQICAANHIGLYVLQANLTTQYDVFCYNASDSTEKNCEQYDYRNKSIPSHDPTEEGVYNDSESSKVSPTHPGLDVGTNYNDQWTASEDVTSEPEMSTEQSEHSGDHSLPTDDGETKNYDPFNAGDELITVETTDEKHVHQEDGSAPGTDPSSHWNSGTKTVIEEPRIDHLPDEGTEDMEPSPEDSDAGESSGSPHTKQKRKAAVPDWLIVCVSLVCLGLIFSVCIALNARRICGQKKKLVINGNKGSPEDGVIMEQNGDTVKSQEMVQLVSKEQTNELGDHEEPLNADEMHNSKGVDMNIGV